MKTKTIATSALGFIALLVACGWYLKTSAIETVYPSVEEIDRIGQANGMTDCFWVTYTGKGKGFGYAYPDSGGANYWKSQFKLPAGSRLDVVGEFPHARHLSFNVYDEIGQPVDRLNDVLIAADESAVNPFIPGNARDDAGRGYSMTLLPAAITAGVPMAERDRTRQGNTLLAPTDSELVQLVMRIYVPDDALTAKGGVELPRARLTLADGKTLEGDELCKAIVVKEHIVRDRHLSRATVKALAALDNPTAPYHPAQTEPRWNAFRNMGLSFASLLDGTSWEWLKGYMSQKLSGGFYSTLDNTYLYAYVDKRYGDVLTIQGRAPSTPVTAKGDPLMGTGQVRYWSFCQNRSLYDTSVDQCVYDEKVAKNDQGEYLIAMSTPELRPSNAKAECGVTWMPWGGGDGIDNPHGGLLLHRHMIAAPDFKESIFAIQAEGEEKQVMGPYYPRSAYVAKAAFEARGCPVK
ncbi:hypothetical protein [Pseudomonas sp. N040]|uniref:hypothetical protein n=1 Tax=Pseudomonas sp. N040 TaxID=2785325 RepID=UPI0018A324C7|nr:hypothetical protein [Pseudomonas sp. N040]MBF7730967.1 hypothetical protein [Pseudomonas sp. N040]MBW7014610.1 hypothetical protein [Pseudomonas sp. N040]